jgi:hypothetical protein
MLPTGEELCTGYLIMPDLVLTARHCAAPVIDATGGCVATEAGPPSTGGTPLAPGQIVVSTDAVLGPASKPIAVAEVTVLPDSAGKPLCGNDVALLRLASPLTAITPIPLRVDAPPVSGETFTGVGYGSSKPAPDDDSGTRRARTDLAVASVGASGDRTLESEWIAAEGPCAGDSGSPALDAEGASFGVMSRGPKSKCQSMIYQRIDVHAAWLKEHALASASRLGTSPPAWVGAPADGGDDAAADASLPDSSPDASPTPTLKSGCAVGGWDAKGEGGLWALSLALMVALRKRRTAVSSIYV